MSKIHEDRVRQAKKLVKEWQPKLPWLAGWTIDVVPGEFDEEHQATASILMQPYIRRARLEVAPPEPPADPPTCFDDLEAVILHELAHTAMILLHQQHDTIIAGSPDYPVLQQAYVHVEETVAWDIAHALLNLKRSAA